MERGLRVPLSPNEENTLRQVAIAAAAPAAALRTPDVGRLLSLSLVEEHYGIVVLTGLGRQRCSELIDITTIRT